MKIFFFKIIFILQFIVVTISFSQQVSPTSIPPITGNWELTFEENFNGTTLNPQKWRVGQHWLGFNGIAANSGSQIKVRNGNLEIKAEKKHLLYAGENLEYVSGEITTFQRFKQKYGYFEARIKYDVVRGAWPAFWTMPDRGNYGPDSLTYESYIKFDLSSFIQSVSSAVLKVKVINIVNYNDTSDISIHKLLSDNWNEKNITWNNKPEYDPAWLALFTHTVDSNRINEIFNDKYLSVNVTDYINNQISLNKNAGFAIVEMFMQNDPIVIGSKEATQKCNRPQLVVDGELLFPTDDAFVRGGNKFADKNYGSTKELIIRDPKGYTSDINSGGMEFDIMESLGIWGNNKIQHALHWDYYGANHPHKGSKIISLPPTKDGFHIYAMNWQPGKVDFYVDNKLTWTFENKRVGCVENFILLSHQLGGWNGNSVIDDENLPATMFVDYVKVYKKKK